MKKLLLSLLTFILATSIMLAQNVITVNTDITADTKWTASNIYSLEGGFIYTKNNATLTIEPGTVIKGNASALVITRGSKIIAEGTLEKPIVFTSYKPAGQRTVGDWGGLLLLGKAPVNAPGGEGLIEGGLDSNLGKYGGTDVADNSGSLKYVRIEYGGIAFQPNNETNSLTLGGVGSGTKIENVQTSFGGDDAFEWFGGTVNGKFLVVYKTVDDMFDTDFGYNGKNQFVLGVSDPKIADISGSNGFESDNDAQGSTNTPITDATFANVTIAGPKVFDASIDVNFKRGAHIRRSSKQDVINAIITGFPTAFRPESANTITAYLADEQKFDGNLFDTKKIDSTSTTYGQIKAKFEAGNTFVVASDLFTDATANNFLPKAGSAALSGAATGLDAYFTPTTYRGAFGTDRWTNCWCEFDPQNADYSKAINYAINADFSLISDKEKVSFTSTTPAGTTIAWDFGNGQTSTDANPVVNYAASGTYNVVLTVTSARGCKKVITKLVGVTIPTTPNTAIVNADITTNTTWTANNIYSLVGGFIYVRNNATLTIEPGTVVIGNASALVITRGSKIIAEGTSEKPIVMTSYKAAGQRTIGDWGGLLLLGKAPVNVPGGEGLVEGGLDSNLGKYGGTDAADNSGILKYVRIEFGGIAFQPNNETNSLTLGGVGTGTKIENVQTSFGGDDAYEWFGGTVNGKNLICFKTVDDMFDTDFGYNGKNQFVLGISDPKIADISGSNGFESDNDAQGSTNTPITDATFANVTLAGPSVFSSSIDVNFKRGAHIRRSSKQDVINAIITGFPTAFRPESANTINAYLAGDQKFDGNLFDTKKIDSTSTTFGQIKTKFEANNTFIKAADIFTDAVANNFLPKAGTAALSGAATGLDAYFAPTTYRGAFGTEDWTKCWAEFDPQNADYTKGVDYSYNADFTSTNDKNKVTFSTTLPAGAKVAWDFGNGTSSTDNNPVVTYASAGKYTVKLTVTSARGCSKTITKEVNTLIAIKDIKELSQAVLFPNPTTENTTLRLNLNVPMNLTIQLTDISGKVISATNNTFAAGENLFTIDSNNLSTGLYFVTIHSNEGTKTLKLSVLK
jgi:PKD repeat protein